MEDSTISSNINALMAWISKIWSSYTYYSRVRELQGCFQIHEISADDQWMNEVGSVGETTQGDEELERQEAIDETYEKKKNKRIVLTWQKYHYKIV